MSLFSLLKFITSHPLNRQHKLRAVSRFAKWQLNTRMNPFPVVYPFTERSRLLVQRGMTGATGNLYCGLHEFSDMGFLLHFLRPNDFFVDIGANVGSYTVLAAGHVGARVIAFEPVPQTFAHLKRNIAINQAEEKVTACNFALGGEKGELLFTSGLDTMNHVATGQDKETIKVPVEILDDVLANMPAPVLLKIDVEGFETNVLNGAAKTLANPALKAIIIELNGSGATFGFDESLLHERLLNQGYTPFLYDPFARKLTAIEKFGTHNTIYLKDLSFVQERVTTAEKIRILDSLI